MRPGGVILALAGVALVAAPFLWCARRGESIESYGMSWKFSRKGVAECAAVTITVLAALTFVSMHWPGENLPRHSSLSRTFSMAINGVSAAIIEEVFFRGWIHTLFRKKLGAVAAIALTSAIFALCHVFVAQAVFIAAVFFPGCVMGMLRERHGNISTSTLFHATANLWAIWFIPAHFPAFRDLMGIIMGG
ncbi:MAG: CPBP family intramembrane metalloprotease [Synergistaceae bacterium]|nr:CPBP family intramembrane metalloprotease [Synergistaceae bacterium]